MIYELKYIPDRDVIWILRLIGSDPIFSFGYTITVLFNHIINLQDLMIYTQTHHKSEVLYYEKKLNKGLSDILLDLFDYSQRIIADSNIILGFWKDWFVSSKYNLMCLYRICNYIIESLIPTNITDNESGLPLLSRAERIRNRLKNVY